MRAWCAIAIMAVGCGGSSGTAKTDAAQATNDAPSGGDGPAAIDAPPGTIDANPGPTPLPTGSVTVTSGPGPCPGGALPGATCRTLDVTCPGVPVISATVAVAEPSGTALGTVVVHSGGGGTGFFGGPLATGYRTDGFRVVQVDWASNWEETPGGIPGVLEAACRPATVYRFLYADAATHASSTTTGYCLFGFSGGSGAVAYAMSHYGLGDVVDYAQLAAGPPFGRIDYGCDPSSAPAPTEALACPEIATSTFAYGGGHLSFVQQIEGAPTCGMSGASAAELARWHDDSVVSDGASYAYPKTNLSFWMCGTTPQEANGLGGFYLDQITSTKSLHCFSGTCMSEPAFSDPAGLAQMRTDMMTSCVPRQM